MWPIACLTAILPFLSLKAKDGYTTQHGRWQVSSEWGSFKTQWLFVIALLLTPLWGMKLGLKGHRPSCDREDEGTC